MTIVTLSGLAILTVWGLVAPRAQWRVLLSWSRRDPDAGDPTPAVRNAVRLVSAAGVAIIALTGFSAIHPAPTDSRSPESQSRVESTWGAPNPRVVNRVFAPIAAAPTGVVDQPILRYLPISSARREPAYIFALADFSAPGATTKNGYIGSRPDLGLSALDSADLVVQVRGDKRCIPVAVAVRQAEKSVSVAVYYGRPNPAGGTANVADCRAVVANRASYSVLIPIDLTAPLGTRTVTSTDGTPIPVARAAG